MAHLVRGTRAAYDITAMRKGDVLWAKVRGTEELISLPKVRWQGNGDILHNKTRATPGNRKCTFPSLLLRNPVYGW